MRETSLPVAGRTRGLAAQAARFLGAGGIATACHYALLTALVESGLLGPTPATCVGYASAAVLNYWMRRRFVFRSDSPHRRTVPRYLAVAGAGFGLNAAVVALGTGPLALPYVVVQVAATGVVLAWNFLGHRSWSFGGGTDDDPAPITSARAGVRLSPVEE